MFGHRTRVLRIALLLADGAAASALFVFVSALRLGPDWRADWQAAGASWWLWALTYGVLWLLAEWSQQLDQLRARWTFRREVADILRAAMILAVSVFSILFLVQAPEVSRVFLVMLFAFQIAFSIAQRRLLRAMLVVARNREVGTRSVLVLGTGDAAAQLCKRLERHPALGYRIIGHLGSPSAHSPVVLGPIHAVEDILHDRAVDEVVAAFDTDELIYLDPVVALCHEEGKRLRVALQPGLVSLQGGIHESVDGMEILTVSNGPDRLLGLAVKRALDVVLSAVALLLLSPVILVVALAVRVDSGSPVFFSQERVGRHGRRFAIYKFRTMSPDAEARLADLLDFNDINGPAFKLDADPRITRVGRVLRRTSLDELPQFWNVVRGDMSLVGPRPPLPTEVAGYDLWHRRRLSMKPGITGLWQVSARLEAEFDRWVELDLRYIDRWSLWLDFKIMLRTLPAMLTGR